MSSTEVLWPVEFYNLEVGRPHGMVTAEVLAILATGPVILAGCEGVGYLLPDQVPGYRLIRNRSTEGHSNVWAYVADHVPVTRVKWHRCRVTWQRVKRPSLTHPPRVILSFRAAEVQVLVAHAPQVDPPNTSPAREEILERLTLLMSPWRRPFWHLLPSRIRARETIRPRVLLWDPNGLGNKLAAKVGGRAIGSAIEGAVTTGRRTFGLRVRFPERAAGVALRSDHGQALRFFLSFPRRWVP